MVSSYPPILHLTRLSDLTSNTFTNCAAGVLSGVATCSVSCNAAPRPQFTGPCGANPLLSPSIVSNCTNGTAYVTVISPLTIPGFWTVEEPLFLTVAAPLVINGSLFFQSSANISLSAPVALTGDFIIFPNSNLTLNTSVLVPQWISAGGTCFLMHVPRTDASCT